MERTYSSGTGDAIARRALSVLALAALATAAAYALGYVGATLLLGFACVLLAILLRAIAGWVARRSALSQGWSLALVVALLLCSAALAAWLMAAALADQADALTERLPAAWKRAQQALERYGWGRQILAQAADPQGQNLIPRAGGIFSTALGFAANLVIVGVAGLYMAASPRLYLGGLVRLLPVPRRARAEEVLGAMGATLRGWLLGRIALMAVNGALTTLGLWLLGVPLALSLGVMAGLLNFIPNIGPIIAGVPAVLVAYTQGPMQAFHVFLLYFVLQMADGYVFTPPVEKRTAALPPALTILFQVLMGVLMGVPGVVLASPLLAVLLVLTKMLYVEDVLGDRGAGLSEPPAHAKA